MAEDPDTFLARELAKVVNRLSEEEGSNTPDFILGEYLAAQLRAFNEAVRARDRWYGVELAPCGASRQLLTSAYLVVAEDSKLGVRVWPYTTWQGAHDAAWFWARHRVDDPDTEIQVEENPNFLLLLNYPDEDGSAVWVVEKTADQAIGI